LGRFYARPVGVEMPRYEPKMVYRTIGQLVLMGFYSCDGSLKRRPIVQIDQYDFVSRPLAK
jgi:hypothetical protein